MLEIFLCLSSLFSTQPVSALSSAAVRKVEGRDERHKIAYSSHFLPLIVIAVQAITPVAFCCALTPNLNYVVMAVEA